jgi:HEAT repeat protein
MGLVILAGGCRKAPAPALVVHGKPVEHWVAALRQPDVRERRKAVQALGNLGAEDAAVVPALVGALKDRDALVRGDAALALLKLGPDAKEAIPALHDARKDRDAKVRDYAAKALEKIDVD